jgi:hypothetical protein
MMSGTAESRADEAHAASSAEEEIERALAAADEQGDGEDGESSASAGDGGGDAPARRARPGRLEREAAAARAEAAEARQVAARLAAQLAEEREASGRATEQSLDSRLSHAEQVLQQAIEAGDTATVVKANRAIAELSAAKVHLRMAPRPQPAQAPGYTSRTQEWMRANPWYGSNPGLTQIAKSAHAQAVQNGLVPDSEEYWSSIERVVEAAAPNTVAGAASAPRPRPGGAGPRSSGNLSRPPTSAGVRPRDLSADEQAAAKIFGMSHEEYRKEQTRLIAAGKIKARA